MPVIKLGTNGNNPDRAEKERIVAYFNAYTRYEHGAVIDVKSFHPRKDKGTDIQYQGMLSVAQRIYIETYEPSALENA